MLKDRRRDARATRTRGQCWVFAGIRYATTPSRVNRQFESSHRINRKEQRSFHAERTTPPGSSSYKQDSQDSWVSKSPSTTRRSSVCDGWTHLMERFWQRGAGIRRLRCVELSLSYVSVLTWLKSVLGPSYAEPDHDCRPPRTLLFNGRSVPTHGCWLC